MTNTSEIIIVQTSHERARLSTHVTTTHAEFTEVRITLLATEPNRGGPSTMCIPRPEDMDSAECYNRPGAFNTRQLLVD
eukprot:6201368-Pleurochrysis_carterae.AAC.2